MAGKSSEMAKFIAGLLFLAPAGLITGFIGIAWLWEFVSGCFFSLSNYCGQSESFKAALFLFAAYGCFRGIMKLWEKTK